MWLYLHLGEQRWNILAEMVLQVIHWVCWGQGAWQTQRSLENILLISWRAWFFSSRLINVMMTLRGTAVPKVSKRKKGVDTWHLSALIYIADHELKKIKCPTNRKSIPTKGNEVQTVKSLAPSIAWCLFRQLYHGTLAFLFLEHLTQYPCFLKEYTYIHIFIYSYTCNTWSLRLGRWFGK